MGTDKSGNQRFGELTMRLFYVFTTHSLSAPIAIWAENSRAARAQYLEHNPPARGEKLTVCKG